MNLEWYDWTLIVGGALVVALIIFATVLSMKTRSFITKEKNGKRKTRKEG